MLGIAIFVTLVVFVKKTSAGVAILGLLAGVLLNQLLGTWVIGLLPSTSSSVRVYVPVVVQLVLTFLPMLVSLFAVKVHRSNPVLSLLTSIMLGILVVFFGVQILQPLSFVPASITTSGFLFFLDPYENAILAAAAVLAVLEMTLTHSVRKEPKKKN